MFRPSWCPSSRCTSKVDKTNTICKFNQLDVDISGTLTFINFTDFLIVARNNIMSFVGVVFFEAWSSEMGELVDLQ
jgi:hypothetical protein